MCYNKKYKQRENVVQKKMCEENWFGILNGKSIRKGYNTQET